MLLQTPDIGFKYPYGVQWMSTHQDNLIDEAGLTLQELMNVVVDMLAK